jgi:hypothetical protein
VCFTAILQGTGGGVDIWTSGGRKRNREVELDDERKLKVVATLSDGEGISLNRDDGSTTIRDIPCPKFTDQVKTTTAQQRSSSAGTAYESLLQLGTSGDLQHHNMRGQHTSVEDTVQHQVNAQQFQSIRPYSVMLQQQQQQQQQQFQTGNFLPEDPMTTASISIQASQAQMLQGHSGPTSHPHRQQQMHLPMALEPNAFRSTQVSQAQNFQALSGSEILRLVQHIQSQQGISSVASEPETSLQQQQLSASFAANAYTSSPLSQAQILQALGGRNGLLQHMQSQQGLFSATLGAESGVQQVLQLPVASPSNVSMSSETSQAQIMQGLLEHIQSQQGLSAGVVAAPESSTQYQQMQALQQNLALLAARENAMRCGMTVQTAGSHQGDLPAARAAASAPPSLPSSGITMWLPDDNHQLSEYQIAVRQQLEIFEAKQEDVESNIQGRKRQVFPGQAGIRCRHCSNLPLRQRRRGAVYYPVKLSGMYQAAQNMASSHLSDSCSQIPPDLKQKLVDLRHRRDTASGGKKYWAEAGRARGLYEMEDGLRLHPGAAP